MKFLVIIALVFAGAQSIKVINNTKPLAQYLHFKPFLSIPAQLSPISKKYVIVRKGNTTGSALEIVEASIADQLDKRKLVIPKLPVEKEPQSDVLHLFTQVFPAHYVKEKFGPGRKSYLSKAIISSKIISPPRVFTSEKPIQKKLEDLELKENNIQ